MASVSISSIINSYYGNGSPATLQLLTTVTKAGGESEVGGYVRITYPSGSIQYLSSFGATNWNSFNPNITPIPTGQLDYYGTTTITPTLQFLLNLLNNRLANGVYTVEYKFYGKVGSVYQLNTYTETYTVNYTHVDLKIGYLYNGYDKTLYVTDLTENPNAYTISSKSIVLTNTDTNTVVQTVTTNPLVNINTVEAKYRGDLSYGLVQYVNGKVTISQLNFATFILIDNVKIYGDLCTQQSCLNKIRVKYESALASGNSSEANLYKGKLTDACCYVIMVREFLYCNDTIKASQAYEQYKKILSDCGCNEISNDDLINQFIT